MCSKEGCNEPNNNKPWCGQCDGHTEESSIALHNAANHFNPYPAPPPPAG